MSENFLIAIVDDDDSAREAVVDLVRAMGFSAMGFPSAADFSGSDDMAQTDCLIADVRMAGMSGLELFFHMSVSNIPIPTILMTGYPDEMTRARSLEAGIECYLAKPLAADELLICLRKALARRPAAKK
jgi:FixJ family two-component response regulator